MEALSLIIMVPVGSQISGTSDWWPSNRIAEAERKLVFYQGIKPQNWAMKNNFI